jgi:DNA-binding IclR family transcriptional regulator
MESWGFLTNHARVLLCLARDPGARLRDIASSLDITERSAYGIVCDLADAGYVVKHKDGRRNRYQVQEHLPLRDPAAAGTPIGEVLALLTGTSVRHGRNDRRAGPHRQRDPQDKPFRDPGAER